MNNITQDLLIVTNNPRVAEKLADFQLQICKGYDDVLIAVRNRVHAGARLVTHPLAGSVKPGESPYRSVAIDIGGSGLDMQSLDIIEKALERYTVMVNAKTYQRHYGGQILKDFQVIDGQLLLSGLEAVPGVGALPASMVD